MTATPAGLAAFLLVDPTIEGISLSGGEPMEQAAGLLALLWALRARERALVRCRRRPAAPGLSLLLFSGLTRATIARRHCGSAILQLLDLLVAGPYRRERPPGNGLLASDNQRLHLLSRRHRRSDLFELPPVELAIGLGGKVQLTGMAPLLSGAECRQKLAALGLTSDNAPRPPRSRRTAFSGAEAPVV